MYSLSAYEVYSSTGGIMSKIDYDVIGYIYSISHDATLLDARVDIQHFLFF